MSNERAPRGGYIVCERCYYRSDQWAEVALGGEWLRVCIECSGRLLLLLSVTE
jgi:hypothetical protein